MKILIPVLFLLAGSAVAADYRVDPGARVEDGTLKVAPRVEGPAGAAVQYEIRTTREGAGGRSNSSQSGNVKLGSDGAANLATTNVSVSPQDRYQVSIRVLEQGRVVAEESVRYPD